MISIKRSAAKKDGIGLFEIFFKLCINRDRLPWFSSFSCRTVLSSVLSRSLSNSSAREEEGRKKALHRVSHLLISESIDGSLFPASLAFFHEAIWRPKTNDEVFFVALAGSSFLWVSASFHTQLVVIDQKTISTGHDGKRLPRISRSLPYGGT